jgi:hypothetical protein
MRPVELKPVERTRPTWLDGALRRLEALGADPQATRQAALILQGRSPAGPEPSFSATPSRCGPGIGITFWSEHDGKAEMIIEPFGHVWSIYPGDP